MKKIKKFGWVLLAGGAAASLGVYLQKKDLSQVSSITVVTDPLFWVEKYIRKYPEILWLADEKVRQTEEGRATLQGSYSEQLFGQKFIEFDRTLMTLFCLHLILDGSKQAYLTFTSAQPEKEKLSWESFCQLHQHGISLLYSRWYGLSAKEMVEALETALVLGDIGKSEKARQVFEAYGIGYYPDHDDFHEAAMPIIEKNPSLSPSFTKLPLSAKNLLVKSANLIHYGHVTHLEGQAGMFSKLKQSGVAINDPMALSFDFFAHICDTAGALGHVNNRSSIVYTQPVYQAKQAVIEAINELVDPSKTESDAYRYYLTTRAAWLGFNPKDEVDCVLTRMGAMLRLFTPEEGDILKKAFFTLDQACREQIITQLSIQNNNPTPTYMPAVLINLSNQLGLSQAVLIGMPFIGRVLEKYQAQVASKEIEPSIPLNFNQIAAVAKSNPLLLDKEFFIDNEGIVHTYSPSPIHDDNRAV